MNEALELQIKRLEFCRDCIVLDYDAGREESKQKSAKR